MIGRTNSHQHNEARAVAHQSTAPSATEITQERTMSVSQPMTPDFLTVDEAAAVLRIGRNALYLAIERGEVRGVKRIGKLIRIRRSALLTDDREPG